MGYASKAGRAYASARSPEAFGQCDRCADWFLHRTLAWQFQWAGSTLQNTRLLVCNRCMDVPQQQLRSITLPADPVPIQNPRVPDFLYMETNYRYTSEPPETFSWTGIPIPTGDLRITEDDNQRVTQQTGEPPGGYNIAPGTDPNAPGNDDPGLPRNTDEVPLTGPLDPNPFYPDFGYLWMTSQITDGGLFYQLTAQLQSGAGYYFIETRTA